MKCIDDNVVIQISSKASNMYINLCIYPVWLWRIVQERRLDPVFSLCLMRNFECLEAKQRE